MGQYPLRFLIYFITFQKEKCIKYIFPEVFGFGIVLAPENITGKNCSFLQIDISISFPENQVSIRGYLLPTISEKRKGW